MQQHTLASNRSTSFFAGIALEEAQFQQMKSKGRLALKKSTPSTSFSSFAYSTIH
jgi:hypothetical protein